MHVVIVYTVHLVKLFLIAEFVWLFGKKCTELLYILIVNKTATIIENIILFDVSAYA